MAIEAGVIKVPVLPDLKSFTGPLVREISSAADQATKVAASKFTTAFKGAGSGLAAAITPSKVALLGLGAAATKGLGDAVRATVDYGAEIRGLQRITGGSAEDTSQLAFALDKVGVGVDRASIGFGIFSKHLVDGGAAFQKYGISLKDTDGSQKSFNEVLAESAEAYNALPPGIQRTTFLLDTFGRSGRALGPLLSLGAAGIREAADEADRFGVVLSQKDLAATKQLSIEQRELQQAFLGVEISLARGFLPVLSTTVKVITTGVNIFNKLPGPIKSIAVAAVIGLGALTALGLVVKTVGGAFDALGISFGRKVAAEGLSIAADEAQAVAAGEAALALEGEAVAGGSAAAGMGATTAAAGGLGVGLGGLALGFGAVAAAIAVPLVLFEVFGRKANDADRAVASSTETIRQFGSQSAAGVKAQQDLAHAFDGVRYSSAAANKLVENADADHDRLASAAVRSADALGRGSSAATALGNRARASGAGVRQLAGDVQGFAAEVSLIPAASHRFLDMSKRDFLQWRTGVAGNINFVEAKFQDLAGQAHLSAARILRAFDNQLKAQQQYGKNFEAILRRGLPLDFARQLADMGTQGAGIVRALANANDRQFNRIVSDWVRAQRIADATTRHIGKIRLEIIRLPNGKLIQIKVTDNYAAATRRFASFRASLPKTISIGVAARLYRTEQGLPTRQHGGPVQTGHAYLVGERGPEVIVPRRPGYVVPSPEMAMAGAGRSALAETINILSQRANGADVLHALRWEQKRRGW